MSEDKYMRTSEEVICYLIDLGILDDVKMRNLKETISNIIRNEIERPEPLEVGVRYMNTEANRKLADENEHVVHTKTGAMIGYIDFKGAWMVDVGGNYVSFENDAIDWFALIPDGDVRDE